MKIEKQITDFIQMRIEGKSFDEIAKALNIAKSTLIDWNKKADVRNTIDEGKAFAINAVVKAFEFDRQARLKRLLQQSNKINDELLSRKLEDISTEKLLQMSITNDSRVYGMIGAGLLIGKKDEGNIEFGSPDGYFIMNLDE